MFPVYFLVFSEKERFFLRLFFVLAMLLVSCVSMTGVNVVVFVVIGVLDDSSRFFAVF